MALSTETRIENFTEAAEAAIEAAIEAHLDVEGDEYNPLIESIVDAMTSLFTKVQPKGEAVDTEELEALESTVAELTTELESQKKTHKVEVKALKKKHKAELKAAVEAASESDDDEKPAKLKRKSKTKSGKPRQPNKYSLFVGQVSHLKTEGKGSELTRSDVPKLASIQVMVKKNFTNTASKSATLFDEYEDELKYEERPILGQTMTLANLYDVMLDAKVLDERFGNGMTRAALMWGLIDEDARKAAKDADTVVTE